MKRVKLNARSLDAIADDVHRLERGNIFAIGDLLIEAKNTHPGEFLDWLDKEFEEWSEDTAENYMRAERLARRFRNIRNLRLGKTTVYYLANLEAQGTDEKELEAIIAALAEQAKDKHLKPAAAREIIKLVHLRRKFGDLPEATLNALDDLQPGRPWTAQAEGALKAKKPTTEDDANKIVRSVQGAYVTKLFKPHGALPPIPADSWAWDYLEKVPEDEREQVLQKLLAAPQPLTFAAVRAICVWATDDEPPPDDDDEFEPEADDAPDASPPAPLPQDLLDAFAVVLRYARGPTPTKVGGITSVQLAEAEQFIAALREAMVGGNAVKRIADRAEARSRQQAQVA